MIDKKILQEKLKIIENYQDKQRIINPKKNLEQEYLKKKHNLKELEKILFFSLDSSDQYCGDEVTFLVLLEKKKILKIWFSSQECCIVACSSVNMISSHLENEKFLLFQVKDFIENVEKMIQGLPYSKDKILDFVVFSNLKEFENRKACLDISISFAKKIIFEENI